MMCHACCVTFTRAYTTVCVTGQTGLTSRYERTRRGMLSSPMMSSLMPPSCASWRRMLVAEFCGPRNRARSDFGDGRPLYRFVVDPVDGSDNWGRGLPLSAVSVAVLPADSPITPARVCWAMVGDLRERLPVTAGTMGPGESAPPECRRCLPPFCRVSLIILIHRHRSADSCSAHGASAPMAAPRRL